MSAGGIVIGVIAWKLLHAQGLIPGGQGPGACGREEEASQSHTLAPSLGFGVGTVPDSCFQASCLAFLCFSSAKQQ